MQRERVQDQYPWTWELPLVVICAVLLLGVTVCQLGRSLANWFAGAGWWWPTYDRWVTSVPAVLAGDAAAGLVDPLFPAFAARLAGPVAVTTVEAALASAEVDAVLIASSTATTGHAPSQAKNAPHARPSDIMISPVASSALLSMPLPPRMLRTA